MGRALLSVLLCFWAYGCSVAPPPSWHLMLAHDRDGDVTAGSPEHVASAVRNGCQIRIAWGARRIADATQTVEHVADAVWISVHNGTRIRAQVDGFMSNLAVLGEPLAEHPRFERFGGTSNAVLWRATLSNDGQFNAIWYGANDGQLKFRAPQRHPMRWYADCAARQSEPLYPAVARPS
ncbi:MAG: hypothetical protein AB8G16_19525 [Gammaproteobacteria bacterium]